jgi:hypothetical protein
MQYRVQFLDGSNEVVREVQADARKAANAFLLVANEPWPPHVVRVRVLDWFGRTLSVSRPQPLTRHPHSSRGLAARFSTDAAFAERTDGKPDASVKECLKRNHQGATGVLARAAASKPPCA